MVSVLQLLLFCCTMFAISSSGVWTQTGETQFPMFDVGINSLNVTYSAEFTSSGSWIVDSYDLGIHWNILSQSNDGLMDIAVSSLSSQLAVVSSAMGTTRYTKDGGNTWQNTITPMFGIQSFARTKDKSMIYGGCSANMIHISYDYGERFTSYTIGELQYGARYAALPTNTTWYITAGWWINDTVDLSAIDIINSSLYSISSKISINTNNGHVVFTNYSNYNSTRRRLQPPVNTMWGEIWKTNNSGITWTKQYESRNEFYFNGIDCLNEDFCVAVGEGDTAAGSNEPGSRILVTKDGGNKWDIVYYNEYEFSSLMTAHWINENEIYCGGGDVGGRNNFNGYFYHTTNGGTNWTNITFEAPIMFMDMNDECTRGVATAIDNTERGVSYGYQ